MGAFNRALQKVSKAIFTVFYVFATISFGGLLIMLLANVVSRNFLGGAIAWIEESSRFVFTWMMFLGISIGVYYKKHLGVEFIVAKYPPKVRKAMAVFSNVLMLFIILVIYGVVYSSKTMRMYSPIMNIPYGLVYLCVPVGCSLSAFYTIADLFNKLFGDESDGEEGKR